MGLVNWFTDFNDRRQYITAHYLGITLLMLGLIFVGTGVGYWLAVQATLNAGCSADVFVQPTTCQEAMRSMNDGAVWCFGLGLFCLGSGGVIQYYLRQFVP